MSKLKKYKMRLIGHSIGMMGISRMNDVIDYYYPEANNINYWVGIMLFGVIVGFWIMLLYSE